MTDTEMQQIINAVIASLRTNGKTIDNLTPVSSVSDSDKIEIGGGRYITVGLLKTTITSVLTSDGQNLLAEITKRDLISANITINASGSAMLSISSRDKTVSCQLPAATESTAGLMSGKDKTTLETLWNDRRLFLPVAEICSGAPTVEYGPLELLGSGHTVNVVFLPGEGVGRFILRDTYTPIRGGGQSQTRYYATWTDLRVAVGGAIQTPGSENYNSDGRARSDKLYRMDDGLYAYLGGALVDLTAAPTSGEGGALTLGRQPGQAFPGPSGKAIEDKLSKLESSTPILPLSEIFTLSRLVTIKAETLSSGVINPQTETFTVEWYEGQFLLHLVSTVKGGGYYRSWEKQTDSNGNVVIPAASEYYSGGIPRADRLYLMGETLWTVFRPDGVSRLRQIAGPAWGQEFETLPATVVPFKKDQNQLTEEVKELWREVDSKHTVVEIIGQEYVDDLADVMLNPALSTPEGYRRRGVVFDTNRRRFLICFQRIGGTGLRYYSEWRGVSTYDSEAYNYDDDTPRYDRLYSNGERLWTIVDTAEGPTLVQLKDERDEPLRISVKGIGKGLRIDALSGELREGDRLKLYRFLRQKNRNTARIPQGHGEEPLIVKKKRYKRGWVEVPPHFNVPSDNDPRGHGFKEVSFNDNDGRPYVALNVASPRYGFTGHIINDNVYSADTGLADWIRARFVYDASMVAGVKGTGWSIVHGRESQRKHCGDAVESIGDELVRKDHTRCIVWGVAVERNNKIVSEIVPFKITLRGRNGKIVLG